MENIYLYLTFYENSIDFKRHVFQLTIFQKKNIAHYVITDIHICVCVHVQLLGLWYDVHVAATKWHDMTFLAKCPKFETN